MPKIRNIDYFYTMEYFFRILKYIKPYKFFAILNIISNILSVLFSLVSLTMVIPFLGILFKTQEAVTEAPPLSLNANSIKENFYAVISEKIASKGEVEALLFICILVLSTFFLRNLFAYKLR